MKCKYLIQFSNEEQDVLVEADNFNTQDGAVIFIAWWNFPAAMVFPQTVLNLTMCIYCR